MWASLYFLMEPCVSVGRTLACRPTISCVYVAGWLCVYAVPPSGRLFFFCVGLLGVISWPVVESRTYRRPSV